MMVKISVILPTYRRPEATLTAVESVIGQTYDSWELIVVDDNGVDSWFQVETRRRLQPYLSTGVVKYVTHRINRGGAAARNTGAEHATGDLFAFLDSDDSWYPRKLELHAAAYWTAGAHNAGFLYNRELISDGYSELLSGDPPWSDPLAQQMQKSLATTSSLVIPCEVFRSIGGFVDLPSSQEADIILRILASGREPVFVDEVLTRRDVSGDERISTKKALGDDSWIAVRRPYMSLVDDRTRAAVVRNYHMQKMSQLVAAGHRRMAGKELLAALNASPYRWQSYLRAVQLFLPRIFTERLYPRWRRGWGRYF